ncbi:MAG: MerR family transcriptional regulator [Clostridia bacterium]
MYSMKETCHEVGMTYEGLKFYCNEGLIPNVKRDANNHRVFDERNIAWIKGLTCLKNCGMSIADIKRYLALCLQGQRSIPQRKTLLAQQKRTLLMRMEKLQNSVAYIDQKQQYYDDVLAGKTKYTSNLIATEGESPP